MDYSQITLDDFLCFSLYSTSRAMTKLYRKYLDPHDLSYPQFLVLVLLWKKDGQSTHELGESMQLDSGTLSPLLKRMERRELLQRIRSSKDERVVHIFLKKEGKKLKKKLEHLAEGMLCDLDMSPEEVLKMAKKICQVRHTIEGSFGE